MGVKEISLDSGMYTDAAVSATMYYNSDKAGFESRKEGDKYIIEVRPKGSSSFEKVKESFMEDLNRYQAYFKHQKENKDLIKSVITKALFTSSSAIFDEAQEAEMDELIKELEEDEELQEVASVLKEE